VKVRYSNFDTHTRQISIPASASDHRLIPAVYELFEKLYDRRLLIRLIGVRFSKLLQGQEQLNLFDDGAKLVPLYQAMDSLKNRYGEFSILRASGLMGSAERRNRLIGESHAGATPAGATLAGASHAALSSKNDE
jgi:DNA polymerase-4